MSLEFEIRAVPEHLAQTKASKYRELFDMLDANPGKAAFVRCELADMARTQSAIYQSLKSKSNGNRLHVRRSEHEGGIYIWMEPKA